MNPVELEYTCKAEDDLDSIFFYIAQNSIPNALRYLDKMRSTIENLLVTPYMGVDCRTKGIDRDCRILVCDNYLVFYQFDEANDKIKILRILGFGYNVGQPTSSFRAELAETRNPGDDRNCWMKTGRS